MIGARHLRVAAALLLAIATAAAAREFSARELEEVRDRLSVGGTPISPRAIQDLLPWISDLRPGPVAVDLATAISGNRYHGEVVRHEKLGWLVDLGKARDGTPVGWIAYLPVGKLRDGRHVLLVRDNGGGTLVSVCLLLVDIAVESVVDDDRIVPRAIVRNRGLIPMGDRHEGTVRVLPDRIEIGADPRSGEAARVVRVR
jgi:hypothetical protein